jgi:hypothetical protein
MNGMVFKMTIQSVVKMGNAQLATPSLAMDLSQGGKIERVKF